MVFSNRDIEKEKKWQEIIGRQKLSGKGIVEFCKSEGLRDNQFYYWRGILAKRHKKKSQPEKNENKIDIPFVPLNITDPVHLIDHHNKPEELQISKIILRIPSNCDKSILANILQSLEKA